MISRYEMTPVDKAAASTARDNDPTSVEFSHPERHSPTSADLAPGTPTTTPFTA
jgi:hypothetical protein